MKELKDLCRENIWNLAPYSCARTEFAGRNARVFLDANENPYNDPYNRYPDPLQVELKKQISKIKGVAEEKIFLGNGSDEAIDLVYRVFCRPGKDNVVAIAPTYGMYEVCADINDVEYRSVLLDENYLKGPIKNPYTKEDYNALELNDINITIVFNRDYTVKDTTVNGIECG